MTLLTRLTIDNARFSWVVVLLMFFAGLNAYQGMRRSEDPQFTFRLATVSTVFPGASPGRVEQLVTEPLETKLQGIQEIKSIVSESRSNVSILLLELDPKYTDLAPIWSRIRQKVEEVELPEGVQDPRVNTNMSEVFGIVVAVTGEGLAEKELEAVSEEIREQLLRLPQVASVAVSGVRDETVDVLYDRSDVREGMSRVENLLSAQNVTLPGGSLRVGDEMLSLEPTGSFRSADDVSNALVSGMGTTEFVRLGDVLDVRWGYEDPPTEVARRNGERAILLAISQRDGGSLLDLSTQVDAVLERMKETYAIGIDIEKVFNQPEVVSRTIDGFVLSIGQSIFIVLLTMMLMLGLRSGVVIAALVPSCMVLTFLIMHAMDLGLDQVSLAALLIALGMLVDNAIVVSEGILTRMQSGVAAREAALATCGELVWPLFTSTATTSAAFLPIYLAESASAEYSAPLFLVVTISLFGSWLLALTLTPLLAMLFLRVQPGPAQLGEDHAFYRTYRWTLKALLRHPFLTLGGFGTLFLGAMVLMRFIPAAFFPPSTTPVLIVDVQTPASTSFQRTDEVIAAIEGYVADELAVGPERSEGAVSWTSVIGRPLPRFTLTFNTGPEGPEYGSIVIRSTSRPEVDRLGDAIEGWAMAQFPEVEVNARSLDLGPPVGPKPVVFRITGPDSEAVSARAEALKQQMYASGVVEAIDDDWGPRIKKLVVDVDQTRARSLGVTSYDVSFSLLTHLNGREIGDIRQGAKVVPIVLRPDDGERITVDELEMLPVQAMGGRTTVQLGQVAGIKVVWEPGLIVRRNRQRTVSVRGKPVGGYTPMQLFPMFERWLDEESKAWELGATWTAGGAREASQEADEAIAKKLWIGGALIFIILVGQFNSFRQTLIVMMTIPFGLIGVALGLFLTGNNLSFITNLGIISLAGIVVNNATVLLDRVKIGIDEGVAPEQAVLDAAVQRLRPIVGTTATTVLGLVPLWWSGGAMWEGMAVALMSGLSFATVLTLGLVPVLYALLYRLDRRTPVWR